MKTNVYYKRNKNGLRHAVILPDGTQYYYKNGLLHREDGPAVIYPNGTQEYYINNKKINIVIKKDKNLVFKSMNKKEG